MEKIKNNKGFVLVETLVVSVFVVTVFTFLYINVMPLVGSYEEEENYDSIDTKYIGNLLKNEITYGLNEENRVRLFEDIDEKLESDGYFDLSNCDSLIYGDDYSYEKLKCNELRNVANINEVYITKYNIQDLKKRVNDSLKENKYLLNGQADAYIQFLPTFEHIPSDASYRIILSIRDVYENDRLYYGTIELDI